MKGLNVVKKSNIGTAASGLTKAQFGEEISSHVALTKSEIDTLFPTRQDRAELAELVDIVVNETNENNRRARLLGSIGNISSAVLKIVGKVIPVP